MAACVFLMHQLYDSQQCTSSLLPNGGLPCLDHRACLSSTEGGAGWLSVYLPVILQQRESYICEEAAGILPWEVFG